MAWESHPTTLDGFTFAAYGTTEILDERGNSLVVEKLEGWEGAPARRTQHTDRPGADGSFRGDAFRGPKSLSLEAKWLSPNVTELRTLSRRLAAICPDPRRLYPLTVADELSPLTAYVETTGDVKIDTTVTLNPPRFEGILSVGLVAANPLRQGPWQSSQIPAFTPGSGGIVATSPGIVSTAPGIVAGTAPAPTSITLTNTGSAPAIIVAQFDGPSSSPGIVRTDGAGEVRAVGATLEAGQSMWVNLSHHHAHDVPGQPAGSFMYGRSVYGPSGYAGGGGLTITNGVWPALAPGETATFLITGGGPGSVHLRPMYW